MKYLLSSFAGLLFYGIVFSQNAPKVDHSAEIDRQIWDPFIKAYATNDVDLFNSLHTKDVLRAGPWGFAQGDTYMENNRQHFAKTKAGERHIAFAFEYRVHEATIGYETGVYKLTRIEASGDSSSHYGSFQVVLKKEGDTWKIAQDWDSPEVNGLTVGKADFDRLK